MQRLDADGLLLLAALLTAAVMGSLAFAPPKWLAVALLLLLGAGWIVALTTLNGVAQSILPNWVRGRGAGGLPHRVQRRDGGRQPGLGPGRAGDRRAGARSWLGARRSGGRRLRCSTASSCPRAKPTCSPPTIGPSRSLAEPVAHDRGPVMIQIEYRIRQDDRPAFLDALDSAVARSAAATAPMAGASPRTPPIPRG